MINEATLKWLNDPEVFRVNRIDAHSDHLFYEKKEDLKLGYSMPLRQSLNGKWKFSYAVNPHERIADFYKEDFNCDNFDEINVPGHIQMQGYDKCQYINTMYPWDGQEFLRPPFVSEEYNPVGSYVKNFEIKEECTVEVALKDRLGEIVYSSRKEDFNKEIYFDAIIENVYKWSAEDPYLYTLYVEVRDRDDKLSKP